MWVTTVALLGLAVYLLFRMKLFSGEPLTDEGLKALWAFLGVALGAAATIIGTLLTDQAGRRSEALARQTEDRLVLDTRARVMELISHEGGYAPPARVAGAVATMMELRGGAVTTRLVGDLWKTGDLGTETAVWLLDRVLSDDHAPEKDKSVALVALISNRAQMFPRREDADQDWNAWPETLSNRWPSEQPEAVRNGVMVLCVKSMLEREPDYWKDSGYPPLETLLLGVRKGAVDPDHGPLLALVVIRFLESMDLSLVEEGEDDRIRALANDASPLPWFAKLADQIGPWGEGNVPAPPQEGHVPTVELQDSSPHAEDPPTAGDDSQSGEDPQSPTRHE